MNRTGFLKNVLGFGLLSTLGCRMDSSKAESTNLTMADSIPDKAATDELRKAIVAAWNRSEMMTMTTVKQMPPKFFTFKYTDKAMTFSEQWRHCVIYTCGQLAGRTGITNPYEGIKLPVQMPKEDVINELENMYAFVRQSIKELSDEKLLSDCDLADATIPVWRLFYALENHIIHHRGQCMVYLRLNGVIPKGYYGW